MNLYKLISLKNNNFVTYNIINSTLKEWWKSNFPNTIWRDVITQNYTKRDNFIESLLESKYETVILTNDERKRIRTKYGDYEYILFFSYTSGNLYIFGAFDIKLIDSYGNIKSEYLEGISSKNNNKLKKIRICSLDDNWCSLNIESDIKAKLTDNIEWRINLILKTKLKNKFKIDSEDIPFDLYTKEGRDIDNRSYHICKLIACYNEGFLHNMIKVEEQLCSYKIHLYHPYERDIVKLIIKNGLNESVDIKKLEDIENVDEDSVRESFIKKYPNSTIPLYGFIIPIDHYKFETPLFFCGLGFVCVTYKDMEHYFRQMIQRDIYNQKKVCKIKRVTRCYSLCSRKNVTDRSSVFSCYNKIPTIGFTTDDAKLFHEKIITPSLQSIKNITNQLINRNVLIDVCEDDNNETTSIGVHPHRNKRQKLNETHGNIDDDEDTNINADFSITSLYPPCIKNIIERSMKRQLYCDERKTFLLFLFEANYSKETVAQIFKLLCDNADKYTKTKDITDIDYFLKKHPYGRDVVSLWKSFEKAKILKNQEDYSDEPDGKKKHVYRMSHGCKKLIQMKITKNNENIYMCPFSEPSNNNNNSNTDIEDLGLDACGSKCAATLIKKFPVIDNLYNIRHPNYYFRRALSIKINESNTN